MSDSKMENLLNSVEPDGLSPAADQRIVSAVRAAGRQPVNWWCRPVPLWQMVAACLLVGAATWLLGPGSVRQTPVPAAPEERPVKELFVRLDEPMFARAPARDDSIDISRWGARGR